MPWPRSILQSAAVSTMCKAWVPGGSKQRLKVMKRDPPLRTFEKCLSRAVRKEDWLWRPISTFPLESYFSQPEQARLGASYRQGTELKPFVRPATRFQAAERIDNDAQSFSTRSSADLHPLGASFSLASAISRSSALHIAEQSSRQQGCI